jgi:hypothetical protein
MPDDKDGTHYLVQCDGGRMYMVVDNNGRLTASFTGRFPLEQFGVK